ncbi:uncharacterized protein LOC113236273, partial [Hyposmocoma kahamanoa]|uniref:uncharacterized protein LOC113236273 n=1 Tax=Hyposmocoma kahamanoa TaxID=1477025 RepID=UPI000E6D7F4B
MTPDTRCEEKEYAHRDVKIMLLAVCSPAVYVERPSRSPPDSFVSSLRKYPYPGVLPDKSADIVERIINCTNYAKNYKLSRSPSPSTNRCDRVDRDRNGRTDRCDRDRKDRPERSNRNDRQERVTDHIERLACIDHVDRIDHVDQVDRIDRTPRDRLNDSDVPVNKRNLPGNRERDDWDRPHTYRSSQRCCDQELMVQESRVDESPTRDRPRRAEWDRNPYNRHYDIRYLRDMSTAMADSLKNIPSCA